jgi:hypothetical protein
MKRVNFFQWNNPAKNVAAILFATAVITFLMYHTILNAIHNWDYYMYLTFGH